jgi:DNA-binding transcriptional ArsR family regulator
MERGPLGRLTAIQRFHNHGSMKTDAALIALAALSQRTRLDVFRFLVEAGPEGAAVGSIADALKVPAPTLSFHLKELSHADLVASKQEGRFIRYTANFAAMNGLVAYLTENCCRGQPDLCDPSCAPKKSSQHRRKRVPA